MWKNWKLWAVLIATVAILLLAYFVTPFAVAGFAAFGANLFKTRKAVHGDSSQRIESAIDSIESGQRGVESIESRIERVDEGIESRVINQEAIVDRQGSAIERSRKAIERAKEILADPQGGRSTD